MNPNQLGKINSVLEALAYSESENYFSYKKSSVYDFLDFHWQKILSIIEPDSFFILNEKPFIVFYTEEQNIDFKSIWNAQIPFVFHIKRDSVYIYNGKNIVGEKNKLEQLEKIQIDNAHLSKFTYWNINNEKFLNEYKKELASDQLNHSLLSNIKILTESLKIDYEVDFATKLVLRIIFIRFLIDRGVDLGYENFSSDIELSKKEFLKVISDQQKLYKLFRHLKNKFNGNLFELGNEESSKCLTDSVFEMLEKFVSGNLILENGQVSLFSMYDFNIISVELISNIYEILLGDIGQQKNKSFYTPTYLVDYILSKTVEKHLRNNKSCTILDPSCGSGIFLVKAYRKIIENKMGNYKGSMDDLLINELLNNIYGVDLSEEAIDVTIFSLYLTLLDYKDPKSLQGFKLPNLLNKNLLVSNFFDPNVKNKFSEMKFDFVLGNPPWGKITKNTMEISKDFIFQIESYLSKNSICSLVLPSKLLYNQKKPFKDFRHFLLNRNEVIDILELSSVRKELFKNAKAPAVILTYKKSFEESKLTINNTFTHISLKPNIYFELFDILLFEKNDVKYIKQRLLIENDWAWKVLLYGSSWDLNICLELKKNYPTILQIINQRNSERDPEQKIVYGRGIEDKDGTDDSSEYVGRKLINSKSGIGRFFINTEDSKIFEKEKIHRARDSRLFEPPYCLYKKGLDMKNYRLKSVYSEKKFLFKDAINVVKGVEQDKQFLRTLAGLLNSSLFSYLNIMLASSLGIEREQGFLTEVLNYPFFKDLKALDKISKLVLEIQDQSNVFFNDTEKDDYLQKLDQIVLKEFSLNDNSFIDYALNIQGPMMRKERYQIGNMTVSKEQLINFSKIFQSYFVDLYGLYGYGIEINLFTKIANQYVAFEVIINEDSKVNSINFVESKQDDKDLLTKFSVQSYTDSFYSMRDVIVFEESSFYILKKDLYKNWHVAMARKDLAEIIDIILKDGE